MKTLRTSDLARAVGIHPNTVRLYEQWGFIPPVERSPKGYRRFTQAHLDCLRLARLALHGSWPGQAIRKSALALTRQAAGGDLGGALETAYRHRALVLAERAQAEAAADYLQRWASGQRSDPAERAWHIGEAARRLNTTPDALRNWERNGLIVLARDPQNGYRRIDGEQLGRLRAIRMLRIAGYSLMAILRMFLLFDQGETGNLRAALDTPRPDEDVLSAADRWLTTLAEQEQRAAQIIALLESLTPTA